MRISKRIQVLANLVTKDDIVADIGCDHALLDVYLLKNNIVPKVFISDINAKALNNGIFNIKKYHLEDRVEAKVSNGIQNIPEDVNTLVISGMGAGTILKILANPKLKQINKIITQANNDYYLLRKGITAKRFYISHESVIYENGKYYVNIVFLKGNAKYSFKELTFGPLLTKTGKDYYEFLYNKNINILENIPKYKVFKRFEIKKRNFILKRLKRK